MSLKRLSNVPVRSTLINKDIVTKTRRRKEPFLFVPVWTNAKLHAAAVSLSFSPITGPAFRAVLRDDRPYSLFPGGKSVESLWKVEELRCLSPFLFSGVLSPAFPVFSSSVFLFPQTCL